MTKCQCNITNPPLLRVYDLRFGPLLLSYADIVVIKYSLLKRNGNV